MTVDLPRGCSVDHHDPDRHLLRCPDCGKERATTERPTTDERLCSSCDRGMGVTPMSVDRAAVMEWWLPSDGAETAEVEVEEEPEPVEIAADGGRHPTDVPMDVGKTLPQQIEGDHAYRDEPPEPEPRRPDHVDPEAEPKDCARCGATFYLAKDGGSWSHVSISHHGQEAEDYAESMCEDCGAALDAFMAGASTEGVDR